MERQRYIRWVRRWSLLLVVTAVAGAIGYASASKPSATYRATAVVFVGSTNPSQDPLMSNSGTAFNQLLSTYAVLVPTYASGGSATPSSKSSTFAQFVIGTDLIDVNSSALNPGAALQGANDMAAQLVMLATTASGLPHEPAVIASRATTVTTSSSGTSRRRAAVEGAVFGLVLALALILLVDSLEQSRRAGSSPPGGD
jgi:capsular polysaccharide biosynthesis protein